MSRIGKKQIEIKEGVEVNAEKNEVRVKGPKGQLLREVPPEIKVEIENGKITVVPAVQNKKTNALWGLVRTLIANMIKGVTDGFEKQLQIEGIGFKANVEGNNLVLRVGFTHPVTITPPENIEFSVDKNIITISGIDKELVGQMASKIRRIKPPDVYKGKGIRYLGEVVRKKVGKKATSV